jgi:hypothetical protein
MPAGATTRQISAKRPFYKGFFGVLIIWRRSNIPVISVSFCPADKIFASAPANFLRSCFCAVDCCGRHGVIESDSSFHRAKLA